MARTYWIVGIAIFISISVIIFLYNNGSEPIDAVRDFRGNIVNNIELIDNIKVKNGILVYSVGEANNGLHYMYSVDMVKKSFLGYKWVGGGGHINENFPHNDDFIMSAQLLTEKHDVHPTLFGVFKDQSIKEIKVHYPNSDIIKANIYKINNSESFYVISLSEDVANSPFFSIAITFDDDSVARHFFTDNELQSGRAIYLDKQQFD